VKRARLPAAVAVALSAVVAVAGCSSSSVPAAAKVGSATVTEAQLHVELSALAGNRQYVSRLQVPGGVVGNGPDGLSPSFVAEILTNEIDAVAAERLLAQRHGTVLAAGPSTAITQATFAQTYGGLDLDAFPAAYRELLAQRTAVDLGLAASVDRVDLSLAALMRYRDAHLAQFATYCVSAILRPSRTSAQTVARLITGGIPVATLAKRESLDPSAVHGGRLGCGTSGMFDTGFTRYLISGRVGAASPPIHDPQGWYVLDVTARHIRTLDEAAPDIVTALLPEDSDAVSDLISTYLRTQKVTVAKSYGHFNAAAYPPAVVAPKT
jgi:parvulin-like peptidyl-prolyl isomerase